MFKQHHLQKHLFRQWFAQNLRHNAILVLTNNTFDPSKFTMGSLLKKEKKQKQSKTKKIDPVSIKVF